MDLIEFKHSLADFVTEVQLIRDIVDKIRQIPNYLALRFDVELTKYVANIIENSFTSKTKDEKNKIIKDILISVYSYDVNEILTIDKHLTFLLSNKKIKVKTTLQTVTKKTSNWFLKKFS